MTDHPAMPRGYTTGQAALVDLVSLSQLLNAGQSARDRLNAALASIDDMLTRTNGARMDALRAVERFADEDPTSLGVEMCPAVESGLADIESNLSTLERDVRDLLRQGERRGL